MAIHVSISNGNSKMGDIKSVSLPAIVTCRRCDCHSKCYANKIAKLRPNVANAYINNLKILLDNPTQYWREVEAAIMTSRFFRFHVSGDIPDMDYLENMVSVSSRNKHCGILCFTKKYNLVNEYIDKNGNLPENLHMTFSGWPGLKMDNPHNLPEAHVRFKDGTTTARADAKDCGGNCTECAITDSGCWVLQPGEQVIFDEH